MTDSMAELLHSDLACETLLECLHGLTTLDTTVFEVLAASEVPLTVDEVAERVERERSTAYRSVQRLRDAGFVDRDQVTFEAGSYTHVYDVRDPGAISGEMQRLLNDWYAKVGGLIQEFEDTYGEAGVVATEQ